jgi:hypothetical protein
MSKLTHDEHIHCSLCVYMKVEQNYEPAAGYKDGKNSFSHKLQREPILKVHQ